MPPRIPILPAFRQGLSLLKTPSAPLSTTAAPQALRDLSNSTSSILDLEGGGASKDKDNADSTAMLGAIYKNFQAGAPRRGTRQGRLETDNELRNVNRQDDYMRQLPRRWRAGDVYAPHDMSPSEMAKWRRNTARKQDLVDLLGLRPLDMYRNFSVISEFMTPHGRIKRAAETGLSPVNQRKMAKAIRRSIGLGLHPSVHHHPELLMRGPNRVLMQSMPTFNQSILR
ncbi:ribosomal protein S18 [Nemania sp. FL0031]|nr:ribosomal protein S18 [Nemania sp. FL0031]KAI0102082.1 ribosomal protein S18 [Nemania sp. FL0031]